MADPNQTQGASGNGHSGSGLGTNGSEGEREHNSRASRDSFAPIQAVFFDMDGTLVDSEPLWHRADESWLKKHNIVLPDEEWMHVVGLGGRPFLNYLMSEKGLKGDPIELYAEKNEIFRTLAAKHSRAFPQMLDFVLRLKEKGITVAVASASSLSIIETTLECIGQKQTFAALFSTDMVEKGKPDPMLFLHAASELGVTPEHCLVVEDSQYGVQAGHRSGMTVIAVPESVHPDTKQAFDLADLLLPIKEFSCDKAVNWLTSRGQLDPSCME